MNSLTNIDFWRRQFGLYPVFMNPQSDKHKFLLLNGGNRDFCLQTNLFVNDDAVFSDSWSTNTKNFIALDNDYAHIYYWYNAKREKYPIKQIEENADRFYDYLSSKSHPTPSDVVPFIIDVFRQLRNLTGKREPVEALNLLFKLLISIEEDYTQINSSKWEVIDVQTPSIFDYYVDLIRQGVKSISPNRDLILRHVSGALFQEAHKEVIYFDARQDLFGGFSNRLATKNDNYSSVHYTPQYLARSIVENCLKQFDLKQKNVLKIFDPACGSSQFLVEVLKQLKNSDFQGKVNVVGWDISQSAVCTSKFLLRYEQQTQWNSNTLEYDIRQVSDSLTEKWDNDYDLIVMNPPFVSWELLNDKKQKEAVLDTLGSSYERERPNQAGAFFYKAAKSLNKEGVMGCVLPYSMFTSDIYTKIRQEIQEELNVNLVAKLGNYVFEDALTDVGFFVGRKKESIIPTKLIWTKNENGAAQDVLLDLRKMEANNQPAIDTHSYSIYSGYILNSDSWKIIPFKSNVFKQNLERFVLEGKLNPIADIFSVNQGALLGIKNVFKISPADYSLLPKTEQRFFRPIITSKSIRCGQLNVSKYVWFPYDRNGMMIKDETDLKSISYAAKRLIPNRDKLSNRKGINEWWGLTRPRNWQFEKGVRLYSTRFGNSNSFAVDMLGTCIIEEGNAFIPEKQFTPDDYYFYLSVFSSNLFDTLLSIFSKQIMSGYDLGKIQIKDIPIPNVHLSTVRESDAYYRLVELGKELENGNPYVKHAISDIVKIYYPKYQ